MYEKKGQMVSEGDYNFYIWEQKKEKNPFGIIELSTLCFLCSYIYIHFYVFCSHNFPIDFWIRILCLPPSQIKYTVLLWFLLCLFSFIIYIYTFYFYAAMYNVAYRDSLNNLNRFIDN